MGNFDVIHFDVIHFDVIHFDVIHFDVIHCLFFNVANKCGPLFDLFVKLN